MAERVVVLNGRHSVTYKKNLSIRLKEILKHAIQEKEKGAGLFARPEVDAGLFCLLNALERLEPGIGWQYSAIITATHSIDTALMMNDKWWWPRYEEVIREYNFGSPDGGFGLNFGLVDHYIEKQFRDHVWKRLKLSETLSRRYTVKKNVKWESVDIQPLPIKFPKPLWINKSVPAFPQKNKAAVEKYGRLIAETIERIFEKSIWDSHYVPMYLGDFTEQDKPEAWGDLTNNFITNSIGVERDFYHFAGIPILQRLFDGTATAVLEAINTYIGVLKHYTEWHNEPYSFEIAMGGLLVNNQIFLNDWVRRIKNYSFHRNPQKTFNCLLLRFLNSPTDSSVPYVNPLKGKYLHAYQQAVIGLMSRNRVLLDESVLEMLNQWPKVQDGIWVGYEKYNYCIPAMAIQRTALRLGMEINIPNVSGNDPDIVLAEDPKRPFTPYCTMPGADLVADRATIQWPSLFLNEPVDRIVELEEKTLWTHQDIQTFFANIEGDVRPKLKVRIPGGIATNLLFCNNTAIAGRNLDSSYGIRKHSICAYYKDIWGVKWAQDVSFSPESIIISDNVIYATTSDLFSPGYVYAFDVATGEKKWERRLKGTGFHWQPIVVGNLVIVATEQCVCAYEKYGGKLKWKFDTLLPSTIIISNEGFLYFGVAEPKGSLCALDVSTGKTIWHRKIGKDRIITITSSDESVYAASFGEQLCHLNPNDGKIEHKSKERICSNVFIQNGIAYAALLCDNADIKTLGAFYLTTDKNKWISDPAVLNGELNYLGSIWGVFGSRLYSGDSNLHALNIETGQIVWSIQNSTNHPIAPVGFYDQEMYLFHKNDLWILDESGNT